VRRPAGITFVIIMDADERALPATDQSALDRLERFGGPKLLREMIALFVADAPRRIVLASDAAARGDLGGLEQALHSLKSSAAQLGALRMQRICERGELLAQGGSLDGAVVALDALQVEWVNVREWLEQARHEESV
jgi:HPt (histidine-containing phosphotransfer) domain-containing protein